MVSCCFEPIRGLPVNPCYGPEADMLYHYESPQVYGCRARWYMYRESLTHLFDYLERMIDVVVANPDGFNDYVAHN